MEKFTKGPWHVDSELRAIYNKQCNYICDYPLNNSHDKHLIAAAPDMYKMLDTIETVLSGNSEYNATDISVDYLRKLLAKARGEL